MVRVESADAFGNNVLGAFSFADEHRALASLVGVGSAEVLRSRGTLRRGEWGRAGSGASCVAQEEWSSAKSHAILGDSAGLEAERMRLVCSMTSTVHDWGIYSAKGLLDTLRRWRTVQSDNERSDQPAEVFVFVY